MKVYRLYINAPFWVTYEISKNRVLFLKRSAVHYFYQNITAPLQSEFRYDISEVCALYRATTVGRYKHKPHL